MLQRQSRNPQCGDFFLPTRQRSYALTTYKPCLRNTPFGMKATPAPSSASPKLFYPLCVSLVPLLLSLITALLLNTHLSPSRQTSLRPAVPGFVPVAIASQDRTVALGRLQGALRFPTVSFRKPGGDAREFREAIQGLHEFLKVEFPLVHRRLKRTVVAESSLLYEWEGTSDSRCVGEGWERGLPVLMTAHLDVVPPGPESSWSSPPFDAYLNETTGYVVGRGALDDKISVVGFLEATERLLRGGYEPCRTFFFAFGHDEELGGREGAREISRILQERGVRLAFMLDEGYVISENNLNFIDGPMALVGIAEKGRAGIKLRFRHRGGHASMSTSSNALIALSSTVHTLSQNPPSARLGPVLKEMFSFLAPEASSLLYRIVLSNTWLFHKWIVRSLESDPVSSSLVKTIITPSMIQAGVAENVIPDHADLTLDVRIVPGETVADLKRHVENSIRRALPAAIIVDMSHSNASETPVVEDKGAIVVEITFNDRNNIPPSPVTDIRKAPWFDILAGTLKTVFRDLEGGRKASVPVKGVKVAPGLLMGNTDSRHYWNLTDQIFRFTPMFVPKENIISIHGADEKLHRDSYESAVVFYHEFMRNVDSVRG